MLRLDATGSFGLEPVVHQVCAGRRLWAESDGGQFGGKLSFAAFAARARRARDSWSPVIFP
jgi:hypothetical protein